MKNNKLLLFTLFTLFVVSLTCIYQDYVINKQRNLLEKVDTIIKKDTVYNTISITDTVPKYITKTKIKTDTLYTPNGDTIKVDLKKKEYSNQLINQNDTIQYHAFLTGRSLETEDYPTLDSINIKASHRIINTTTIIEKPIPTKKKLFCVSPQAGVGYGLINKKFDTYVGIGIGINF